MEDFQGVDHHVPFALFQTRLSLKGKTVIFSHKIYDRTIV